MAPKIDRLLKMRNTLGVRNSTHILVKIIQPFIKPALRLVSYTHPKYLDTLSHFFIKNIQNDRGDIFLMRATEGETIANIRRSYQIKWFHQGKCTILDKKNIFEENIDLPNSCDAKTTVFWIKDILNNCIETPQSIVQSVQHCLTVTEIINMSCN